MPGGFEMTVLLFAVFFLIPVIFYLITLQKTLEAIIPENRKMPPGQVWLLLIPLFNLIWQFIAVNKIAESIKAECERLHVPVNEDKPTYNIGTAKNILGFGGFVPAIGVVLNLAAVVCWIIYWVKVNEYKNLIIANKDNALLDAERGVFHGSATE